MVYIIIAIFSHSYSNAQHSQQREAPWIGDTIEGFTCKGKGQGFGPFDYTQKSFYTSELSVVERAHFTPRVEALVSGERASNYLQDLDYTLRAWPNHHRALNAIIRHRLQNLSTSGRTFTPAECYLQRALNFSPDDSISHMLYGLFLHRLGKSPEALERYNEALRLNPSDLQDKV